MDKETAKKKPSFFESVRTAVKAEAERRKSERGALLIDIAVFLCAFFFARRHVVFGTYPLAAALVAVLPARVWIALIGAVSGSLSLGKTGIIHAGVALIIAFLRIIISSGGKKEKEKEAESALFSEPLIMRLSAATIGAFVGAGYEILLSGFSFSSVMFGVFGVGLTLGFAFVYSGLFFKGISAADLIFGEKTLFRKKTDKRDLNIYLFQASLAFICFLVALSLESYTYFGISLAYIFSSALTLFSAKRFGAIRGMAIGFISSVGVSAIYSPAFALLGALSGVLYPFGIGYGLVGGGIVFSLWGAYVGGIEGFLSLLPEYLISALLIFGALRRAHTEKEEEVADSLLKTAEEMVGASWLSQRNMSTALPALEEALCAASDKIKELSRLDAAPDFEEYRKICESVLRGANIPQNQEIINIISTKLYKKQNFSDEDESFFEKEGVYKSALSEITAVVAEYERGLYEKRRCAAISEEYGLISKMINEARLGEAREKAINENLTELAAGVFTRSGFPEGSIRVFGEKKIKVIGAGLDVDGRLITSPDLKLGLEEALGQRLGGYEYFRKGDMALFKCSAAAAYTVDYATAAKAASESEISGDSARFFGNDSSFFSVISDGMGSGREARECADFATAYLSELLLSNVSVGTAAAALSHIIRQRGKECTATLDLFSLDLLSAEATFIKSGAAPSYVKRGKSIFRIRSETAPIGLLKNVDAEKIKVEIKSGDIVIMLSDGVAATVEDSAWLLSYLTKDAPRDMEEYAKEILTLAKRNRPSSDDMTVSVVQILSKE